MADTIATVIGYAAIWYVALGAIFAVAVGLSWGSFRGVPGVVVFWPVIAIAMARGASPGSPISLQINFRIGDYYDDGPQ